MRDNNGCGGCAGLLAVILLIGLIGWILGLAFYLAGFAVIGAGFYFAYQQLRGITTDSKHRAEIEAAQAQIAELANESANDLRGMLFEIQNVIGTRGIGTKHEQALYEGTSNLHAIAQDVEAVIRQLEIAPDAEMQLVAVVRAERLRAQVREEVFGRGT